MNFAVETKQETDGRWIAEIPQIPGVMAYGADRQEAISRVQALASRVKGIPMSADLTEDDFAALTSDMFRMLDGEETRNL